ncbi:MAG: hypothetical protein QM727_08465 [Niabella sp.]
MKPLYKNIIAWFFIAMMVAHGAGLFISDFAKGDETNITSLVQDFEEDTSSGDTEEPLKEIFCETLLTSFTKNERPPVIHIDGYHTGKLSPPFIGVPTPPPLAA